MILEPAVSLTDFALAAECGILAALIWRKSVKQPWFALFFASLGAAALLGGIVHGFLPDETAPAYSVLWRTTLIAIGLAAVAAAIEAVILARNKLVRQIVIAVAVSGFAFYLYLVVLVRQDFRLAIFMYLPATVLLFISFILLFSRTEFSQRRRWHFLIGATGLFLTLVAAAVQQSRIAVGVLDHNAVYHLIQAVALVAIHIGAAAVQFHDQHSR